MKIANVSINDVPNDRPDESTNGSAVQSGDAQADQNLTILNTRGFETQLAGDIDSWSEWRWAEPFRTRLGAAIIGGECERAMFYGHRHIVPSAVSGQKARLFNRGHREEPFNIEILRGIGFTVHDKDENGNQFGFQQFGGHYAGRSDGVMFAPARFEQFGIPYETPILLSCKTVGTGQAFTKWHDDPVAKVNPTYWAQENALGYEMGIKYAVWFVTNKNDDSVQPRIEELDLEHGKKLREKAHRIIFLTDEKREIPRKAGKAITAKICQPCQYRDVCHSDDPELNQSARNCRSCENCRPQSLQTDEGKPQWYCDHPDNQAVIPSSVMTNGCGYWSPLIHDFTEEE